MMKGARILLVDDDEQLSLALCGALEALGYTVTYRTSVSSAFAAMTAGLHCDVLLLDLCIGDDRGEQLVVDLVNHNVCMPPVIILSGQPTDELTRAGSVVGARKVLQKPFDMEALDNAISLL